jgi:hypothetical protein
MLKTEIDDSPRSQETLDSSAKFHEQLADDNYIKVAGGGKKAGQTDAAAQPAETPAPAAESAGEEVDLLESLRKADPKELSPSTRAMQGLVENFATADNKAAALGQLRPAFEKTVKETDDNFTKLSAEWNIEAPKLKPEFEAKGQRVRETQENLNKLAGSIDKEEMPHMQSLVKLWSMGDKNSPELKAAIEKEMNSKVPGFADAVKDNYQAKVDAAPVFEKVTTMQAGLSQAMADRVDSRMIYEQVLLQGGDKSGAQRIFMEHMAIQMGVPQSELEELMKRQSPPEKK